MSGRKGMIHYAAEIKAKVREAQKSGQSVSSLSKEYGISRYAFKAGAA